MGRNFNIFALMLIFGAAVLGGTLGNRSRARRPALTAAEASAARSRAADEDVEQDYKEALGIITSNYASDIDFEKATQAAIQGMLITLDPHSNFFSRAEYTKLLEDQDSRFYGIGVSILQHRDGVYVESVVEDTPAARAGLRYGDRIVEVDGKDAREWTSDQVSKNVRGDRGVPVRIKVERAGEPAPVTFTIVRAGVPLPSVRSFYMTRPGVGYIALTGGFQVTTADELRSAISKLKTEGLRQLVLDLRGNPGGLLNQAIEVASEFIPRGETIVSVRGRSEYTEPAVYQSTGRDPQDFPLVVLINRNTASASEIVAGAIQDHGRGLIVGETSFGKGLVQHVFNLPLGTGLTLTTAKYYTPYGRSLQRDYSNGSIYDYYVRHDADDSDSKPKPAASPASPTAEPNVGTGEQAPAPHTPTGPAVKTAGGRVFYGGGGITPDIEVRPPAVTPLRNRIAEAAFYFTRQLAAGKVAGLESYRVEKTDFKHTPRATDFPITDRVIEAFREFVQRDSESALRAAQIEPEMDFVKLRLRAEILTAAFGGDAGIRVLNESDPQTLRAIDALPDAKRLAETIRASGSQG